LSGFSLIKSNFPEDLSNLPFLKIKNRKSHRRAKVVEGENF